MNASVAPAPSSAAVKLARSVASGLRFLIVISAVQIGRALGGASLVFVCRAINAGKRARSASGRRGLSPVNPVTIRNVGRISNLRHLTMTDDIDA